MTISRRGLIGGAAAVVAASGLPFAGRGDAQSAAAAGRRYSRRATELMRRSLVIDMLAPLKIEFDREFYTRPVGERDAAEFRASGITGFHHAFGIGGPTAREQALTQMAIVGNYAARNGQLFAMVGAAADLDRAKREGKCAIIMGFQNADQFQTVADVKLFHDMGLRCAQLTYNSQNRIGGGSTDRVDGGVSDYGQAIIGAMNEAGMLIDVSHSGDRTTLDAIALSKGPIAITHSNCRAIVPGHPRVKTDEAIRALAAKGGVMGITGVRNFVSAKEPTTISNIADHVDHVAKLVGIEHVGIGTDSDLNGYDDVSPAMNKRLRGAYKDSYAFRDKIDVDGFDHPRKMFDLTEELIRRRYSDANIQAVLGGNFRRLLATTWGAGA